MMKIKESLTYYTDVHQERSNKKMINSGQSALTTWNAVFTEGQQFSIYILECPKMLGFDAEAT
jgi:hypothetical protein